MDAVEALTTANSLYERLLGRRPSFNKAVKYFKGDQPLNFATIEWKKANASIYADFSDNWTASVVNAENERLAHTGVRLAEDTSKKDAAKLWDAWLRNEMEMQSSQGFLHTLTVSRSFILVWGNENDEEVVTWETGTSAEIQYDWENPRLRRAAIKTWLDEKNEYLTLYTPANVWKYKRERPTTRNERDSQADQAKPDAASSGGWLPREIGNEVWPLPNPMGVVPMIEIQNRPILGDDPLSEIPGTMSMQDFINLMWAYLGLSADYASMEARVVLGQGPPEMPILDDKGQPTGRTKKVDLAELREKRIAYFQGKETRIDSWKPADLKAFLDVIDQCVGHIAAQTRTPPTYLVTKTGMSNVNADGLKASEIPIVNKVAEFWVCVKPVLREFYRLVALARGDKELAEAARGAVIEVRNAEIRSEAQMADMLLKKKSIGYPLEYLMELDGVDPVTIGRVLDMREQELTDPQIEAALRGTDDTGLGNAPAPNPAEASGDDSDEGL